MPPPFNEPEAGRPPVATFPTTDIPLNAFGEALMRALESEEAYKKTIRAMAHLIGRNHSTYCEPRPLRTAAWGLAAFLFALWFIHMLIVAGMDREIVSDCIHLTFFLAVIVNVAHIIVKWIQTSARTSRR